MILVAISTCFIGRIVCFNAEGSRVTNLRASVAHSWLSSNTTTTFNLSVERIFSLKRLEILQYNDIKLLVEIWHIHKFIHFTLTQNLNSVKEIKPFIKKIRYDLAVFVNSNPFRNVKLKIKL